MKKLQATELRIGNLVKLMLNDEDYQILKIQISDLKDIINENGLFEPLELKENWLVEHGFKIEKFDYTIPISDCEVCTMTLIPHDAECSAYSVCVTQKDEGELDENVFLSDISYVHEVQNLFFALTKKEL